MNNIKFTLQRDKEDSRDFRFSSGLTSDELPTSMDLRYMFPPIWDQGNLGSCTANATGALRQYLSIRDWSEHTDLSRLFIYWYARFLGGNLNYDNGSYIRDAFKALSNIGCPPEEYWPYDESKFKETPSPDAFRMAENYKILEYHRMFSVQEMKQAIAGYQPVVIGGEIFSSIMGVEKDGMIKMPNVGVDGFLGGHAMIAVGYNDDLQCMLIRNSWGTWWGDNGYGWMPYAYFMPYIWDMWTGQHVKRDNGITVW